MNNTQNTPILPFLPRTAVRPFVIPTIPIIPAINSFLVIDITALCCSYEKSKNFSSKTKLIIGFFNIIDSRSTVEGSKPSGAKTTTKSDLTITLNNVDIPNFAIGSGTAGTEIIFPTQSLTF